MDPFAALDVAESIERPSRPNTPLLLDASRPLEVSPPTAPEECATVFSDPPAAEGTELAVFMTVPVAAPAVAFAVEATPPASPPPLREVVCIAPIPPPDAIASSAANEEAAADWADATA